MKSNARLDVGFQGVVFAVLTDCQHYLSLNHTEVARDNERLHSLLKHRGIAFATLDLPAMGKIFDQAIDRGLLSPETHLPYGFWSDFCDENTP